MGFPYDILPEFLLVPSGYGSSHVGHFTSSFSSCMTLMVPLLLPNKHQQSVRCVRKTGRLSRTSERSEASVERSLECVCIWVEGFIISRSPLSLRYAGDGFTSGAKRRTSSIHTPYSQVWFYELRLWRSRQQNGLLHIKYGMIGSQAKWNSVVTGCIKIMIQLVCLNDCQ
jgi:hypothetical protein